MEVDRLAATILAFRMVCRSSRMVRFCFSLSSALGISYLITRIIRVARILRVVKIFHSSEVVNFLAVPAPRFHPDVSCIHHLGLGGLRMLFNFKEIPATECYKLLVSTVTPRPIAWVVTQDANGVLNAGAFSFFNAFSGNPPVVGIGMASYNPGRPK